jgi:exopolysaccharide biosynthesis protein
MRGSVHITRDGQLSVGPRGAFPLEPVHDLLQAGPLLTVEGVSVVTGMQDPEGFSSASHQFDSDISKGCYPRAAIGLSRKYIWSIACDGRSEQDAGLTLAELAQIMLMLGAEDALNLDGGSSASQVSGGKLRNRSRGDGISFPYGKPIHTAIIFK